MEIRAAILNPDRDLDPRRGMARVVLSSGTKFSGVVRNEDNFSIQLQTMDGAFHLLNKSDIRMLTYSGASAMPSDYGTTLNNSEINDLVSFLLRSARTGSTEKELRDRERDEEE
jgi:putative heme-binding domain-containing protein